jgi:hypothetical protein
MRMSIRFLGSLAGALALASITGPVFAQTPTAADVGDPDSFGHNVIYLGRMQSVPIVVRDPCLSDDPRLPCTSVMHDGADTIINETELGVMRLPARATKTLICFVYTPFVRTEYSNAPPLPGFAHFSIAADVTIENSVLNDPALLDSVTGQPLGGKIKVSLSTLYELRGIVAGQYEVRQETDSLFCGAGLISRRQLMERYKLTSAQATAFFTRPITLRFGASGQIHEGSLDYHYSFRFFGDN